MYDYNCPDCNETKLQSDKNARKINEVIEQVNALIQVNNETVDFIEEKAEEKVEEIAEIKVNEVLGDLRVEVDNIKNLTYNIKEEKLNEEDNYTNALQRCIDKAFTNGGGKVLIPSGVYIVNPTIVLPNGQGANVTIEGMGSSSQLFVNSTEGSFLFTHGDYHIGGVTFRNFDIRPNNSALGGAIHIKGVTRAINFENIRVFNLKYGFKLSDEIWSTVTFNNCKTYLPTSFSGSIGFDIQGNTVNCYGCESVGYEICVKWNGNVGVWDGGSIAGSPDFLSQHALYITNAKHLKITNVWFEQINSNKKTVLIENGNVTLDNVFFADGSLYINNGHLSLSNVRFETEAGSIYNAYGARVTIGDNVTAYNGKNVKFNNIGIYTQGKVLMSNNFEDSYNSSYNSLIENSNLVIGRTLPFERTHSSVILNSSSDYTSGDRAIEVVTDGTYRGVKFSCKVIPNKIYKCIAKVKILTDDTSVYITQESGSNTLTSNEYPNRELVDKGWNYVICYLVSSSDTLNGRIISAKNGAKFVIDSFNIIDGVNNVSPEYSPITNKQMFLNGQRVEHLPAKPFEGKWKTGDIVFNQRPTSGGYVGWICINGDNTGLGTWKGFGLIES